MIINTDLFVSKRTTTEETSESQKYMPQEDKEVLIEGRVDWLIINIRFQDGFVTL